MRLKFYLLLSLTVLLASCSSDMETTQMPAEANYFPLTNGNVWNYENTLVEETGKPMTNSEKMTLNATAENDQMVANFTSSNPSSSGVMTKLLDHGKLVKNNKRLIYNGEINFNLNQLEDYQIPITSLILYDVLAPSESLLKKETYSIEKEIVIEGQSLPVTFNYSISTENKGFYKAYVIDGKSYSDVLQANMIIEASMNIKIGPLNGVLLTKQKVLTVENFYARNTGLVYSEATINFVFEDFSEYSIPQIDPIYKLTKQKLTEFVPSERTHN